MSSDLENLKAQKMVERRVDSKANKNENGEHYEYKVTNQNNTIST